MNILKWSCIVFINDYEYSKMIVDIHKWLWIFIIDFEYSSFINDYEYEWLRKLIKNIHEWLWIFINDYEYELIRKLMHTYNWISLVIVIEWTEQQKYDIMSLIIFQKMKHPLKLKGVAFDTPFRGNEILISFIPINDTYTVSIFDLEIQLSCCGNPNPTSMFNFHVEKFSYLPFCIPCSCPFKPIQEIWTIKARA